MPQIQIIDQADEESGPRGVMGFLNKLGEVYKENKDKKTFENLLNEYQQNIQDENAYENLQLNLMKSDISPKRRLSLQGQLNQMQEGIVKKQAAFNNKVKAHDKALEDVEKKKSSEAESYELLKANGLADDEAKRLSKVISPANAKTYGKPQKGSENKLDKFDQTLQSKGAEEYTKLQESIPKAKDALANLDRLEQLSKNELSGPKGFAKAALNTESAAEFTNLAFTSIEPIIKLFNPVGPIPVQKLKIIQQQFQMHPGELQTTTRGKIAALRRIGEQGLARNEQRAALLRKHRGLVPEEELKQFDQQSLQLQDALIDQESFAIKIKDAKEDDMIEGLYSKEGKKLKPMTKKKAVELYNQGLITNVPE